jgi:hypothetical protein
MLLFSTFSAISKTFLNHGVTLSHHTQHKTIGIKNINKTLFRCNIHFSFASDFFFFFLASCDVEAALNGCGIKLLTVRLENIVSIHEMQ